jgi:CO/xanthine dehydrogenase Mo-binding subunit
LRGIDVKDINGFVKPGLAAAVVEVTINLVECIPIIRGVWLAVDGGRVISFNRARRSLTRSAAQALGWSFTENIEYIKGLLPKSQYKNYNIFSPGEIPPIHIDFISSDDNETKGIGDLPFTCIPAAFLQAVSQAMDHCFKSIPLKRNDIWELINLKPDNIELQELK